MIVAANGIRTGRRTVHRRHHAARLLASSLLCLDRASCFVVTTTPTALRDYSSSTISCSNRRRDLILPQSRARPMRPLSSRQLLQQGSDSFCSSSSSSSSSQRRHRWTTRRCMSSQNHNSDDDQSWTTFQPAPPPGTHGTPVFPNVERLSDNDQQQQQLQSWQRNRDPNAVFVVTGAARGIGLEMTRQLAQRTNGTIVACCRGNTPQLQTLAAQWPDRIDMVPDLELQDQTAIEAVGQQLRESYDRVDALFNVAGLLGDGGKTTPGPERALRQMDRAWLEQTLAVNVIGPTMLTKELAPLLMQRGQPRRKQDTEEEQRPAAVVVNLSARVGSISDNGLGGWYSYRMSKAALNQATRTMALEFGRSRGNACWAVALHPGTTDTDLSLPFQANVKENSLFPVQFTVHQLLTVVDSLEDKHSGGFYDWAGQSLSF